MLGPDLQRIEHILDFCGDIESTLDRFGRDFITFQRDRDFYNSISMSLLQIGELAKGLSDETIKATSGIPWTLIKGMRDHFAHGYGEMDSEIIFNTAVKDTSELADKLKQIVTTN